MRRMRSMLSAMCVSNFVDTSSTSQRARMYATSCASLMTARLAGRARDASVTRGRDRPDFHFDSGPAQGEDGVRLRQEKIYFSLSHRTTIRSWRCQQASGRSGFVGGTDSKTVVQVPEALECTCTVFW